MKKQIIISSFIAATLWSGTALAVINTTTNAEKSDQENQLLAANTPITTKSPIMTSSKNETVFVMTDEAGDAKTKFIGNTIYDGTESLPFDFKVTYFLDGQEISAKNLAGKSGHVKIVFNYNSSATYSGKFIPFVAVTGITLNHSNFTNVKVTNGKIINENSDSYIIAGYSVTGLNENLGTNLLPSTFTLEADTTNFKIDNTYTLFTNDVIADLDTSKLNSLDELTNSVYQLEDGINKLVNGGTELSNGLASALDGTKTLYEGSKTLASGLKDAETGSQKLTAGLNTLTDNNDALQTGASAIVTSTISELATNGIEVTTTDYADIIEATTINIKALLPYLPEGSEIYNTMIAKIADLTKAKSLLDFGLGVIAYTNGVKDVAAGSSELSAGLTKLATGSQTLSDGLGTLVAGEAKLYEGSVALKDGLNTFKAAGIDKLVNFAEKDLASFIRNLRSTVTAAGSYRNYGGTDAKSVKFIVKTPSI